MSVPGESHQAEGQCAHRGRGIALLSAEVLEVSGFRVLGFQIPVFQQPFDERPETLLAAVGTFCTA